MDQADGREKGPGGRPVLLLVVPPDATHLLAEEPFDDAFDLLSEVGSQRDDFAVDAWLPLAREEGLAIVLPRSALADPADGLPRLHTGGIEPKRPQQHQAPRGGGPFRKERALALGGQGLPPIYCLSRGERGGPAFVPVALPPPPSHQNS